MTARYRLTVELEVTDSSKPAFVFCKLPNGHQWAVPREIFEKYAYEMEGTDLQDLYIEEFGLRPREKPYLILDPRSENWVENKDWIKGHGGTYVPKKKCWILCWDGYDLDDYELHRRTIVFEKLMLDYLPVGEDLYDLVKNIGTGRYAKPMDIQVGVYSDRDIEDGHSYFAPDMGGFDPHDNGEQPYP